MNVAIIPCINALHRGACWNTSLVINTNVNKCVCVCVCVCVSVYRVFHDFRA